MKKLLSALLLTLALVGCTSNNNNQPEEPKGPAAITTLDVATFADEMANTEITKVKVDVIYNGETEIEWGLSEEETELRTSLVNTLKTLNVTESENQDKQYGSYLLFVDLNSVLDTNYARLIVMNDLITIKTSEGYKNYTVDENAMTVLNSFIDTVANAYIAKNAE